MQRKKERLPEPSLDIECSKCEVLAEKDRLANVLAHLIDNAQQATADDGMVVIKLTKNGSVQLIEIRDDGEGMDDDFVRKRLFKPFDTTKGNEGMGIGMFESRDFVRSLGGDIHVKSEAGKGTTVSLELPHLSAQRPQEKINA